MKFTCHLKIQSHFVVCEAEKRWQWKYQLQFMQYVYIIQLWRDRDPGNQHIEQ